MIHILRYVFFESNLLENATDTYGIIVANLPYVDRTWERSPETEFEPAKALFAKYGGLELIKKLIVQSPAHLSAKGYLVLEADPRQHGDVTDFAVSHGFSHQKSQNFILVLRLI